MKVLTEAELADLVAKSREDAKRKPHHAVMAHPDAGIDALRVRVRHDGVMRFPLRVMAHPDAGIDALRQVEALIEHVNARGDCPAFTGPGVSWRSAVDEFGWNITADGLQKKAQAAPPDDPFHVLGVGGPGRIPGKSRNYLRLDAVRWVKAQCEAKVAEEITAAKREKREEMGQNMSPDALRNAARLMR